MANGLVAHFSCVECRYKCHFNLVMNRLCFLGTGWREPSAQEKEETHEEENQKKR